MDFMNLNQSAHGGREFGYICTRMCKPRKVIVGHYEDVAVQQQLADWLRAAAGWAELQSLKVARFGDNMRQVAVTEGDKVEAQMRLGVEVNGYGMGDLVQRIEGVTNPEVDALVTQYDELYAMADSLRESGPRRSDLRNAARVELGLRAFLEEGSFHAFTDTFEDLHGMQQLPGLAVQRLMADGYGFGAEGDWKHAALLRTLKVMAAGLPGGTSFMEDYTYHLDPQDQKVLGAHMLEICPSLAARQPSCEIHPLGIGGKSDPVRLVFDCQAGPAINASLVDLGDRFRLVVNQLDVVPPDEPLPKLPVARALWVPQPDLVTAATAWIYAGGAHHTAFSLAVTAGQLEDLAEMAGVELLLIDRHTQIPDFKKELRWNAAAWR
jgi:L-arabinose isomerase